MKRSYILGVLGAALCLTSLTVYASAQASDSDKCASLAQLKVPNLTITSATALDAIPAGGNPGGGSQGGPGGGNRPPGAGGLGGPGGPGGQGGRNAQASVKAPLCQVVGFMTPTSDSHIGLEVWLPVAASWNHKLEGVGNGGFSGNVNRNAMVPGLTRGYATMATDYGHLAPTEDISWALGHPEKAIDYSYRAEHLTTLVAKQIIDAYYGANPQHSYYVGCSAGGIQGIQEFLRYPTDYDGYIVGDGTPAHMNQELGAFWNTLAASLSNEANAFTPDQINIIHDAVLKQCIAKAGAVGTDQFLSNPQACKFDTKALLCAAGQDAATCLNAAQIAALDKIYSGPMDAVTHKPILAGVTPGGEAIWRNYFSGKKNPVGEERPWAGFMEYLAYSDPDYLKGEKYLTFNWGTDLAKIDNVKLSGETLDSIFNAKTRDMDPVKAEGGKVIQYHGWDDSNIPPMEAVNLFNDVVADQAKRHKLTAKQAQDETEQFYRLFLVPGMGHCSGGAGPNSFGSGGTANPNADPQSDMLSALELWVEKGMAPESFIASHSDAKTRAVDMTRPICAYPLVPTYKGTGSTSEASSFTCAAPNATAAR